MKRFALAFVLAPASVLGLVASAAPARADDLDVGVFFGGSSGGHGGSRGFFGIDLRRSFEVGRARVQRQPRVVPAPYAPAAYPPVAYPPVAYPPVAYPPVAYPPVAHPAPHLGRQVFIPAHEVCRSEVVCEPEDVVVGGGTGGSSVVAAGAAGLVASQTPPPPIPTKSRAPTTKSAIGGFRAGAVFKRAPVMSVPENPPVAAPIAPPGKPEMRPSVGA